MHTRYPCTGMGKITSFYFIFLLICYNSQTFPITVNAKKKKQTTEKKQ